MIEKHNSGTSFTLKVVVFLCLAISIYNAYQIVRIQEYLYAFDSESDKSVKEQKNEEHPKKAVAPKPKVTKSKKIVASCKVRVEDRYVNYGDKLPEGKFTEEGTVTVKVYVDWSGDVTKTSILNSTITDEDVQYACRQAAVKTHFSMASGDGYDSLQTGTIVYYFTAE